jgi:NAD(P)H dehydrogenase (quinone)
MKTLIVLAHPRSSSLTFAAATAFAEAIAERGNDVAWADLVREAFDPVLLSADEPDWNDPNKCYSAAARAQMDRIERNDATVMIFPVWWWSMPAVMKGWVDRVGNNGWA